MTLTLLLLAACGVPPQSGRANTCLGNDADDAWGEDERAVFSLQGTYAPADDGPDGIFACSATTTHRAAITDGEGVTWTLGWGVAAPDGEDRTPELDLDEGALVTMRFRGVRSFGDASGFVLSDPDGLVAAVEVGVWGSALEGADLPIPVTAGEQVGTISDGCGVQEHTSVRFGDVEVAPFGSATVAIDGADHLGFAVASYDWREPIGCTDTAGAMVWGVWR